MSYLVGKTILLAMWLPLLCALLAGCAGLPGTGGSVSAMAARLRVASSPALLPLLSAAAALFERQHPEAQIAVERDESVDGLRALANRQVDIAATTLYADPVTASAAHLRDAVIAVVAYVLVAQRSMQVASLSQMQILGIFSTGQITDWRQVGGPEQKLVVVLPPSTSDTRFLFREEILGSAAEGDAALSADSLEALRDLVARTPGGIGYLPDPLSNSAVQAIAIDGREATAQRIASGAYPFWSFAHLYARDSSTPEAGETTLFLQFMQSAAAAQLASQLGYIPLSEMPPAPVAI